MKLLPTALAVVLLTSACTHITSGAPVPAPAPANLAVIDPAATADAVGGLKTATEAVFSYDSKTRERFDKASADYLDRTAQGQLAKLFDQVLTSPEPVQLTTRVLDAAALELTAAKTRVLAVVQQTSVRDGASSQALAALVLTAAKDGGRWRIGDIVVSPTQPPVAGQPADGSPAAVRDSALAGARSAASALLGPDSTDAEGWYARAEAATAEPLLSEYRGAKARYIDQVRNSHVKTALDPGSVAAATAVDAAKASILFFATTHVTDAAGKESVKTFPLRLQLVRDGAAWKVSAITTIQAS